MRTFVLVSALLVGASVLQAQDKEPAFEVGAAYGRVVTEKEKGYLGSIENLSQKLGKMKTLSQENKEDTIVAMKEVVKALIAEGKDVVSAFEKYKSDSKAYMAALDRMPSALRTMADAARVKAQKYTNTPMGKQYESLEKEYSDLANRMPFRRKDVEDADAVIAQAVKETESAIEFLSDYSAFLDVLALGDITAARQAFREKLHHFLRNYIRFDSLMMQFHEKLRATSTSDEIRKDYENQQRKKLEEQQERERQRIQTLEMERQQKAEAIEAENRQRAMEARLAAISAESDRKQREADFRRQYNANRAAISKLHADARRGLVVGYIPPIPPALPRGTISVPSSPQWYPVSNPTQRPSPPPAFASR